MSRATQPRSFRITIELPEPLLRSLERIAALRGVSIEQVVLAALRQYVSIAEAVEAGYREGRQGKNRGRLELERTRKG